MCYRMVVCCHADAYVCVCTCREYLVKNGSSPRVNKALSPGGKVLMTLLNYVWSLWEDPLDVS